MSGPVGPQSIALAVRAYLENHPRPRLVVLCLAPFGMEIDPAVRAGDLGERFLANYGPEVGTGSIWESAAYFIRRGAQTPAARDDPRDCPLLHFESETYRTFRQKRHARRGFVPIPGEHGGTGGPDPKLPPALIRDDWAAGVDDIATTCRSIPLFVIFPPMEEYLKEFRDFSELDRWSDSLEARHENVGVRRPIVVTYPHELMWDPLHLNAAGVAKFMPLVAKDVQAALKK